MGNFQYVGTYKHFKCIDFLLILIIAHSIGLVIFFTNDLHLSAKTRHFYKLI